MIRLARASDIDKITAGALAAFAAKRISRVDPIRARAIVADVLARSLALVDEDREGRVAASMGLDRRRWDWSGEPYVIDRWTFASGSAGALQLMIGRAQRIAERWGCKLYLGEHGGDQRVMRLYRIAGGDLAGALFRF